MARIQFGTDGWRAVIAEDFTFANVARVSQATADYWLANPIPGTKRKVIVGYDRRFLSDQFARRSAEVLAANGFAAVLTPVATPTPAVSLAVKAQKAVGGVMITASHNPAAFNGFKLKAHFGGSAESSMCQAVESHLDRSPVRTPTEAQTSSIEVTDLRPAHYRAIKSLVDFRLIARSRLRFAHDALYGVGAGCFEDLLARTTCRVTTLNGEHNPGFGGINPEPVPQNYARSSAWLRQHPQDVCIVTDGDADRVGGMDGRGRPLSTHQMICLILNHLIVNRQEKGRVVKALSTTAMVDKMCAAAGLPLVETPVGFKYIAEESGGIGFAGHIPERDGILAGLMLLEMLATERVSINKLLHRLEKQFSPHRYARVDTHFPSEKRAALMAYCQANPPDKLLGSPLAEVKTFDGVKYVAADTSWLMLRGSGTEPILRIYAEAGSDRDAQQLLKLGVRLTRQVV
jgi:phosphomannomutase